MKLNEIKTAILPTKMIQVDEKLYRGTAVFFPGKAIRMQKYGIDQVIDLRNESTPITRMFRYLEQLYLKKLGIKYINKEFIKDSWEKVPEIDYFENINEQIAKSGKTYVHCTYGKHRTGFVVAMYNKSKGMPNSTILEQLKNEVWDTKRLKKIYDIFVEKFFPKQ